MQNGNHVPSGIAKLCLKWSDQLLSFSLSSIFFEDILEELGVGTLNLVVHKGKPSLVVEVLKNMDKKFSFTETLAIFKKFKTSKMSLR